jgi:ribosome-binding protein aMBF1 (putative translation factor)
MKAALRRNRRTDTLPGVRNSYRTDGPLPRRRTDIDPKERDLQARFALHLRSIMERKGWTSRDVAERITAAGLNIGPRGIDVWLRAEGMPKAKDIEVVGRALGFRDYRDVLPPPLQ